MRRIRMTDGDRKHSQNEDQQEKKDLAWPIFRWYQDVAMNVTMAMMIYLLQVDIEREVEGRWVAVCGSS